MSKKEGQAEAINAAVEKLKRIPLTERCVNLGLPGPENGAIKLLAFGYDMILDEENFNLTYADTGNPVKQSDHILVLHYLLCSVPLRKTEELITFRELPGGQFYWDPFLSRSVKPLCLGIGNDIAKLKKNLSQFNWEAVDKGDFGARIHLVGILNLTLLYYKGDEEFGPSANLLFDSVIKWVYNAEDVAVLTSQICLRLIA